MSEGRTLWQILTKREEPLPVLFNPLSAKIGQLVTLDKLDYRGTQYRIDSIREYERTVRKQVFKSVDYYLTGGALPAKLRLNPTNNAPGQQSCNVIMLKQFDELQYDKGFEDVLDDPSMRFDVTENGATDSYTRINDVHPPWNADVAVLKDWDGDGKVTPDELKHYGVRFWDYWRQVKNEAGEPYTEFLFVEKDISTGMFTLWRGEEVDAQTVSLF